MAMHDAEEAAGLVGGPSGRFMAKKARLGEYPAHRIGRSWMFSDENIQAILAMTSNNAPTVSADGLTPRSKRRVSA